MNNFTVLKLTTGQDVICIVDESKVTEQLIEISHPMMIISIANPDGTTMIFLRRYNLLAKSPIMKIRRAHIVATYAPRLELAKYYKTLMKYHDEVLDKITIQEVDLASTFIDTYVFFFTAFAYGANEFMAANWHIVATNNSISKILVSLVVILPAYGLLLSHLQNKLVKQEEQQG